MKDRDCVCSTSEHPLGLTPESSFDVESGPAPAAGAGPSAFILWEVTGCADNKVRSGKQLWEMVGPANAKAK